MTVHLRAEKLSGSSPSKVTSWKSILLIFAIAAGVAWQLSSLLTRDHARKPKIQTNAKNVLKHLKNLQSIAESHGSSRSVINGHLASADYVMQNLALYNKTWKSWTEDVVVKVQVDKKEPKLAVEFGNERLNFLPRIDVGVARGSGSYKGRLALKFPSGCAFKGFAEEWGAVIDGTDSTSNCTSCQRMLHAIELGAKAVIFVSRPGNQDGYPHSMPPSPGRCGRWSVAIDSMSRVAVLSLGDASGFKLLSIMASNSKVMADFDVESAFENFTSKNVLAETIKGDANNVVLFGSHLDGVPAGPGINDDGSGSMATLELARALAESPLKGKNKAKIRLAFWTGEEIGLLGSTAYVANLVEHNPEELMKIKITLDIDMIASPNYIRGIYDAGEIKEEKLRIGSLALQRMFENYFHSRGLPTDTTPFDGRSDYAAFMDHGIPSGGIFTGADAIKTTKQAEKFGGVSGIPLDPCYHQDCDRVEKIKGPGMVIMHQNMDALGHVLEIFATSNNLEEILYSS